MRVQEISLKNSYREKVGFSPVLFCSQGGGAKNDVKLDSKDLLRSGLKKLDKITKEEYEKLTDAEKSTLRNATLYNINFVRNLTAKSKLITEYLHIHQLAANAIKTVLDKQYGEDKYVVVTIGRSLSSIGKLLGMKIGEDNVKNIPLSELNKAFNNFKTFDNFEDYSTNIEKFKNKIGYECFKNYLEKIGLDKTTVENSGKHYLIMDYSCSGRSLNAAYAILTDEDMIGNSKRNVEKVSMNQIVNCFDIPKDEEENYRNIKNYLADCRFKVFSYVGRLLKLTSVEKMSDYNQFLTENYMKENTKIFGFLLMDSEFGEDKTLSQTSAKLYASKEKYYGQKDSQMWLENEQEQLNYDIEKDKFEIFKLLKTINMGIDIIKNYNNGLFEYAKKIHPLKMLSKSFLKKIPAVNTEYSEIYMIKEKLESSIKDIEKNKSEADKYYNYLRPNLCNFIDNFVEKYSIKNTKEFLERIGKTYLEKKELCEKLSFKSILLDFLKRKHVR